MEQAHPPDFLELDARDEARREFAGTKRSKSGDDKNDDSDDNDDDDDKDKDEKEIDEAWKKSKGKNFHPAQSTHDLAFTSF